MSDNSNKQGCGCVVAIFFTIAILFGGFIEKSEVDTVGGAIIYYMVYPMFKVILLTCHLEDNCDNIDEERERIRYGLSSPPFIRLYFERKGHVFDKELDAKYAKMSDEIYERAQEQKRARTRRIMRKQDAHDSIIIIDNGFVDLRIELSKYKNIKFKENNRAYNINSGIIKYSGFKRAISEINAKFVNVVITETTEGTHAKGAYSHENGYKIDIRTFDRSFEEILEIMKIFDKNNIHVSFEFVDTVESKEIANILNTKYEFQVRPSDNGEHIDINLARCSRGLVRSK